MSKRGKDFQEVVADIADRKRYSAATRSDRNRTSVETPREIYLAGCEAIANVLQDDGYKYVPSGQKLRRKTRDFIFQVSFQSSHLNIRGKVVVLWVHGYVFSPVLKKWRVNSAARNNSDFVAGGQIGNLVAEASWLEWNLAQTASRDRQIASAVATIKQLAYPYFAIFEDIPVLVRRLVAGTVPSMDMEDQLDSLLCFGSQADVKAAAVKIFQDQPGERDKYAKAVARFRTEGLPPPNYKVAAPGDAMAAATVTYNLTDLA